MKVSGSEIHQSRLRLGVCTDIRYCHFHDTNNYYPYYGSGLIHCGTVFGGTVQGGLHGIKFQDGDVLKFKLDHDVGSFELHVERTGEHRCISGMQITDMALYFFADARRIRKGMQVEIL
eukprot:scpid76828/ scgid5097/ 